MSILSMPILLKSMFQFAIADLRKNPWIVDDIFSGLAEDPLSYREYGYKECKAAKDWFLASNIDVVLQYRVDTPRFPSIAIARMGRNEMAGERTTLGDDGMIEDYNPRDVTTIPPFVYAPFTPKAYNPTTGLVTLPANLDCNEMVPGQFYIAPQTGKAYQIISLGSDNQSFTITPNVKDNFTGGYIIAAVYLWNLHREIAMAHESYTIECLAVGDPAQGEWLADLVWYILMRYKEAFIEGRGFELTTPSAGPLRLDERWHPQKVFTTPITLSGNNQISWIKFVAPKIQGVKVNFRIADGPKTPPAYLPQQQKELWQMEADPIVNAGKPLDEVHPLGDDDIGEHFDEENLEEIGEQTDTNEDPTGQT